MAGSWKDLTTQINEWKESRLSGARNKVQEDAETLKSNIIGELQGSTNGENERTKELTAKTNVDSATKQGQLAPSGNVKKSKVSPQQGLDTYTNSIIIEDESKGSKTIQVVKISEPNKKDETTGMSVVKIAKAIEYGTTQSAPRPAWRRSLNKVKATGVYRKSIG